MKKINLQEDYKHVYEELIEEGYIEKDEDEEVVVEVIIERLEEEDLIDIFDRLLNQYHEDSFMINEYYNCYLDDYIEFYINNHNKSNCNEDLILHEEDIDECFYGTSILEFISNLYKNQENGFQEYLLIDSLNHYYFYDKKELLHEAILQVDHIEDEDEARSILLELFL